MLLICSISANCNVVHKVGADHKKRGCSRSRLRDDRGQLFHRRITIHTSQLSHHSQRGVTINASHSAPITASNIAHQTSQQLPRLTSEVAAASKQQSQGYLPSLCQSLCCRYSILFLEISPQAFSLQAKSLCSSFMCLFIEA